MKNLKNMVAVSSLMAILMVGTASANTELFVSDAPESKPAKCTVEYSTVIKEFVKDMFMEVLGNPRIFYMAESGSETSTCTQEMNGRRHG